MTRVELFRQLSAEQRGPAMTAVACKDCAFYKRYSGVYASFSVCLNPALRRHDRVSGPYQPFITTMLGDDNLDLLAECDDNNHFTPRPPRRPWWKLWRTAS